ncbi:unnamed protein product, partial [Dibothriocephalus latus]
MAQHGPAPTSCDDLSCEMAELVSLLSAGFTSLGAKKAFLQKLTNVFLALADAAVPSDILAAGGGVPQQQNLLPFLRLVVLFRYQLHYFFDPPKHLNAQLRPLLSGDGNEHCLVWQFPDLKRAVDSLPEAFKPAETVGRAACFYDLLLPHSTVANDETSETTATSLSTITTPPADGLALITLISRTDYDQVFGSLLRLFDRGLGRVPPPPGPGTQSIMDAKTLVYVYYSFDLSWRLLEVLPPSPDFVGLLRDRFQQATGVETGTAANSVDCPVSPNRFIYLVILLDRLRRFATAPYFDLQKRTASLVQLKPAPGIWSFSTSKEMMDFKPANTSSTLSKFKPNVRCMEMIANQVFKAQCSRTATSNKPALFSSTDETEAFFGSLRNHSVQSVLLLEEGYTLLEDFKGELSTEKLVQVSLGRLIYLSGTLDVFYALITRLRAELASADSQQVTSSAATAKR